MAGETVGIADSTWRIFGVILFFIIYIVLWLQVFRPGLISGFKLALKKGRSIKLLFFHNSRKYSEEEARKVSTIIIVILDLVFIFSFIPVAYFWVRRFSLEGNNYVESGKYAVIIGAIAVALVQSRFAALALGGLKVILMNPFKVGDSVAPKTDFGDYDEGMILEIGTHDTKIRWSDSSVETIANEKIPHLRLRNFDFYKFHHKVFKIPVYTGENHVTKKAQIERAMGDLNTEWIYNSSTDDMEWWDKTFGKLGEPIKGVEAVKTFYRFRPTHIEVYVPVRSHLEGKELESDMVAQLPEIFARASPPPKKLVAR